jgi:hypothetical protein
MRTNWVINVLVALSLLPAIQPAQAAHTAPEGESARAGSAVPESLLQFTAGGHALGFAAGGMYAATGDHALHVEFSGSNAIQPQSESAVGEQGEAAPLGRVTYPNLWDGITLTYTADPGGIYATTYTLAPGADPAVIRLQYNAPLALNEDGTLGIAFEAGKMTESAPVAWQEIGGRRLPVKAAFRLDGQEAGFALGSYDPQYGLTIDPVLAWNTFLGGLGDDFGTAIAVDGSGNVYVAGSSTAVWSDEGNPVRAHAGGGSDAFVAKLNSSGYIAWNTFLGGSGQDNGYGIAADGSGNVFVAGTSTAVWGSPVRAYTGGHDAFVAELDPNGTLVWNTFLGGSGGEFAYGIALDGSGNIYLGGYGDATWGTPVRAFAGDFDAFAAKLTSSGALTWNTFLGGSGTDKGYGIAVDSGGIVYLAGAGDAAWGSPLRAYTGGYDAFAAKLTSSGALTWNTFLGGGGNDIGDGIGLDGSGYVYVMGRSDAAWGSPVRAYTAGNDAFVVRISSSGTLSWQTFLGGAGDDIGYGFAVDGTGNSYVTGRSNASWGSPVNPLAGGYDSIIVKLDGSGALTWNTFVGAGGYDCGEGIAVDGSGNVYAAGSGNAAWGAPKRMFYSAYDAHAVKFNSSGALTWSTFLGGAESDYGNAIAVDGSGNVYVAGASSASWGTPLRSFSGDNDAFVAKLNSSGGLTWSTFLGGSGRDYGYSIAVDGSGNVCVAGSSSATWGSPVRGYTAGMGDAFAAKLNSSGALIWNTFLGGSPNDYGSGVAVDGSGNVYVAGGSEDTWGSPVRGFTASTGDAFAAKLTSSGALTWNTFLGGSGGDGGNGISVDMDGKVYIVGYTIDYSWGSPVRGLAGFYDVFAARLASDGALDWNTFLGGVDHDLGYGIDADGDGNVYVLGISCSAWGSPLRAYSGEYAAFVAKLNSSGALIWNTFLGGGGYDTGHGIALDGNGNIYVVGQSDGSWGSPLRAYSGKYDAFVVKLNSSGSLASNAFLGGAGDDTGNGIAVDGNGNAYVTGSTGTTWGSPVQAFADDPDAFVAKVSLPHACPLSGLPLYDFSGDCKTDVAVYRPATYAWYVRGQPSVSYGAAGDKPVPGDYNGDGTTDIAVFRPSTGAWYIRGQSSVYYGASGDLPVPRDYNGDGTTEIAVFRPSTGAWYVRGMATVYYGTSTDIPIPGDYDGDGDADIAVFRPSTGAWYVRGMTSVYYGVSTDIPVPGDYNGDGTTDIAVYRPSTGAWYIRGQASAYYGVSTDIPVPGDYDADGATELAVFRPATGAWYVQGQTTVYYGASGDIPIPELSTGKAGSAP